MRLRLQILHHPREAWGPQGPWELWRGFRLEVLSESLLALTLGATSEADARGDPLRPDTGPGEETLLVVPAPMGPSVEAVEEAALVTGWTPSAALLLSDDQQLRGPDARALRQAARRASWPVVWVLQEMPSEPYRGLDFFNVEQSLCQLGRIGRRLSRRVRWRRWLPW